MCFDNSTATKKTKKGISLFILLLFIYPTQNIRLELNQLQSIDSSFSNRREESRFTSDLQRMTTSTPPMIENRRTSIGGHAPCQMRGTKRRSVWASLSSCVTCFVLLQCWMLTVPLVVEAQPGKPCGTFKTQVTCEEPSNTGNPNTGNIPDPTVLDGCIWCVAEEVCIQNSTDPSACLTANTGTDTGSEGNVFGGKCPQHKLEANCTAVESCQWCAEGSLCRDADKNCPGDINVNNFCRVLMPENNCTEHDDLCVWCADTMLCRGFEQGCGNGNSGEGTVNCAQLSSDETTCTANEECQWCSNDKCRGVNQTCPTDNKPDDDDDDDDDDLPGPCLRIKNGTECAEASCQWCPTTRKCRASLAACPGNENNIKVRPNLCHRIRNETECVATTADDGDDDALSCVWCDANSLCRANVAECPGQGRGNPCKAYSDETTCQDATDATCRWFQDKCLPARGLQRNGTMIGDDDDEPKGMAACPTFVDAGNCTASTACRWCPQDNACRKASQACEQGDDKAGTRGNPCKDVSDEDQCMETPGCLYCKTLQKCRKATHDLVCELDDDDDNNDAWKNSTTVCAYQDAQPECEGLSQCQWCGNQASCRPSQANCGAPSKEVAIDILTTDDDSDDDDDATFLKIQDRGLGKADPNAVSVGLAYLYEISESGETIPSSLLDLSAVNFATKQLVGPYDGGDLQARSVYFEADIKGVGRIEMDAYFMLNDGTVTSYGNETWDVKKGDVKINLGLMDWTFCGEDGAMCGNETSAFVDVAFEIKGSSNAPEQSEDNRLIFNLGGNVPLLLSDAVQIDGNADKLPPGFPRAENAQGQGTVLVFRFPRFAERIWYDPLIPYRLSASITDLNENSTTDDSQNGSVAPTLTPTVAPFSIPPFTFRPTSPLPYTQSFTFTDMSIRLEGISELTEDGSDAFARTTEEFYTIQYLRRRLRRLQEPPDVSELETSIQVTDLKRDSVGVIVTYLQVLTFVSGFEEMTEEAARPVLTKPFEDDFERENYLNLLRNSDEELSGVKDVDRPRFSDEEPRSSPSTDDDGMSIIIIIVIIVGGLLLCACCYYAVTKLRSPSGNPVSDGDDFGKENQAMEEAAQDNRWHDEGLAAAPNNVVNADEEEEESSEEDDDEDDDDEEGSDDDEESGSSSSEGGGDFA